MGGSSLLFCIGAGSTALTGLFAMRGPILNHFARTTDRVRQIAFRYTPDPVNAVAWAVSYYLVMASVLGVLFWVAPNPGFALVLWTIVLFMPHMLIEAAWSRRRRKIDEQLAPSISSLSNSVRAGLSLVQSLQRLAEHAPKPIRTEFRIMINEYGYGTALEQTIGDAKARLELPNFNLFASALLVNREMGGDVAETLDRISISLEKLKQMRKTVEAHTSEGRMNIKVLACAPVMMLLLLSTVDSEGVGLLLRTPQGWCVLMAAALLTGIGIFWAAKIVHTEI